MKKTKNKYRNEYEKEFGENLKRRKIPFSYEKDKLVYTKTYLVDFVIETQSGKKIYIETKGHFRHGDTTKYRAVRKANPDIDLRFIFFVDKYKRSAVDKRIPHTKITHGEWCDKNNFKYAIDVLPDEWLEE